jgi:hypothetical protein
MVAAIVNVCAETAPNPWMPSMTAVKGAIAFALRRIGASAVPRFRRPMGRADAGGPAAA